MGKLEEPCFTLNPAGNCLSDLEQLSFFFFFFPSSPGFNVSVKERAVKVPWESF